MSLEVEFTIFESQYDNVGRRFIMEWDKLAERLARHDVGSSKHGSAICCGLFNGSRASNNVHSRTLIALDIEEKTAPPPPPEALATVLAMERQAAVIWTTFSHTTEKPRYRILMPLDRPISLLELPDKAEPFIAHSIGWKLNLHGAIDTGKLGAASLFYLARHAKDAPHYSRVIPGTPTSAPGVLGNALQVFVGGQMRRSQLAELRKSTEMSEEVRQIIEAYNDSVEITDLLSQYGYKRLAGRWKSRYQADSSAAATAIFPDGSGWYSWSDSDRMAGVGRESPGDGGVFGDAMSLFVHYEHDGNFRQAVAALRERYDEQRRHAEGSSG